jgi:hypothetical protein
MAAAAAADKDSNPEIGAPAGFDVSDRSADIVPLRRENR